MGHLRLARLIVLSGLVPLGGCLSSSLAAPQAPASEGVAALGLGLVGQAQDVKLSPAGRALALEAEFQALQYGPAGQPVPWSAEGYEGSVVPTQLYRVGSQDCRGYSQTVIWKTSSIKQIGTACRAPNGLWQPVM